MMPTMCFWIAYCYQIYKDVKREEPTTFCNKKGTDHCVKVMRNEHLDEDYCPKHIPKTIPTMPTLLSVNVLVNTGAHGTIFVSESFHDATTILHEVGCKTETEE